uniref:Uncharacterized protein n=1 Tax=Triticum urartu TaxID=4572 RepID=A0A8R7QC80_TRIUA
NRWSSYPYCCCSSTRTAAARVPVLPPEIHSSGRRSMDLNMMPQEEDDEGINLNLMPQEKEPQVAENVAMDLNLMPQEEDDEDMNWMPQEDEGKEDE